MAAQPVYQPSRQGEPPLLLRVRITLSALHLTKLKWFATVNRHLLYTIDSAVLTLELSSFALAGMTVSMLSNVLLFTLSPRFIISVRELYVRDTQRQWQWNSGIDTGFGVSGQSCATMEIETLVAERPLEMQVVIVTTEFRD